MFELFTLGDVPYPFFDEETTYKKVKTGYRLDKPDECSDEIYAVMKSCWLENPDARPTFPDLFERLEKIEEATEATPAAVAQKEKEPVVQTPAEYVAVGSAD
jgi:hypothetical protein